MSETKSKPETLTVPMRHVSIMRDKEVLTVVVPEHEVRVLQVVHGPDNVRVDGDADDAVFRNNAASEYSRLQRTYYRQNAPDPVRVAYPDGPDALSRFGFSGGAADKAAPRAGVYDHRKAA